MLPVSWAYAQVLARTTAPAQHSNSRKCVSLLLFPHFTDGGTKPQSSHDVDQGLHSLRVVSSGI